MEKESGFNTAKQPVSLSWIETWSYVAIWVFSVFYSMYTVLQYSFSRGQYLNKSTFTEGWSIIGRRRDGGDYEWDFWRKFVFTLCPLYVGHIILGQIFRHLNFQKRHVALMVYGLVAVGFCMTYKVLIYQVLVSLMVATVAYISRSIIPVWLISIFHLYTVQAIYKEPESYYSLHMNSLCDNREACLMLTVVSTNYLVMRYISFSHDLILYLNTRDGKSNSTEKKNEKIHEDTALNGNSDETSLSHNDNRTNKTGVKSFSVEDYLSYIFYFPLFTTGPFYTYDRFHKEMHAPMKPWNWNFVVPLVKDILRVTFWSLFMDVWLHFSYFYSIQHHHHLMRKIPYWMLAGVGYQGVMFFMVKYVSMFGIPANVAKFDGLTPPSTPRCVSSIYKYSELWRYFDKGLYDFMTRHIYFPLGGSKRGISRQVVANAASFIFVFVWHGATVHLFTWAAINFISIKIELVAKLVSAWLPFVQFEAKYIPLRWGRRMRALFWTPVLMMNWLGNLTFCCGSAAGAIYAYRFVIEGFPVTHLTVGFAFYCFVQTLMEYSNYLERKKLKQN